MNSVLLALALTVATAQEAPVVHPDQVVARVLEHIEARPIIVVVDRQTVGDVMWKRVKSLNAFRIHNADGTTNAPIYLVKSDLYREAAQSRDANSDVWCKLAAIIMHELAHTAPMTEKAALESESMQVEKCVEKGHFHAHSSVYLMELARKQRTVKEHDTHR